MSHVDTTLERSFNALKALDFPRGEVESDDLADWILELAEFDGYVAGLATSILAKGSADTSKLSDEAAKLRLRLFEVTNIPNEDLMGFENCAAEVFSGQHLRAPRKCPAQASGQHAPLGGPQAHRQKFRPAPRNPRGVTGGLERLPDPPSDFSG